MGSVGSRQVGSVRSVPSGRFGRVRQAAVELFWSVGLNLMRETISKIRNDSHTKVAHIDSLDPLELPVNFKSY